MATERTATWWLLNTNSRNLVPVNVTGSATECTTATITHEDPAAAPVKSNVNVIGRGDRGSTARAGCKYSGPDGVAVGTVPDPTSQPVGWVQPPGGTPLLRSNATTSATHGTG